MEIPTKKGLYSLLLAACLGLAGCGGGSNPPPPPTPSLSQTASLVNDVDIKYTATFQNLSQIPTRKITHDGVEMESKAISYSPYNETLEDRAKGDWGFTLTSGNLSDADSVTIPNYNPTSNFPSSLDLNERYEGSSKTLNLESLISDKNPEDRPVPITEAKSLDGKTIVALDGYNLTISAIGQTGAYGVQVDYGSDEGGKGSSIISGNITPVPEQIAFWGSMERSTDELCTGGLSNDRLVNSRRLTDNTVDDLRPYFSPDGLKIIFSSSREDTNNDGLLDNGLYITNFDGSDQRRLTPNGLDYAASPVWCNNGKIFFNYWDFSGNQGIASINPDGTGFEKIINEPFNGWLSGRPACSPDSLQIAFSTSRDGNPEVYGANSDGSSQRNLTNNPAEDYQPAWSAFGTKIIFRSNRLNDQLDFDLYSMNPDGGDVIQLTNTSDSELDAVWSHNGTKIIFTRSRCLITDFSPQLFLMDPDGTNWIQLTTTGAYRYPAWRPRP